MLIRHDQGKKNFKSSELRQPRDSMNNNSMQMRGRPTRNVTSQILAISRRGLVPSTRLPLLADCASIDTHCRSDWASAILTRSLLNLGPPSAFPHPPAPHVLPLTLVAETSLNLYTDIPAKKDSFLFKGNVVEYPSLCVSK
ncbi:hypothetical protein EVAR_2826_1 [Eumeta japonica]|uniref:Uncharacterized protein n=1 Tax=Eumeta variegata TaxID=151549 RepID=A0A4C1T387_EUMVA|nr:hypothetical protein EVAR_2826_1 [Eumeta japonica]